MRWTAMEPRSPDAILREWRERERELDEAPNADLEALHAAVDEGLHEPGGLQLREVLTGASVDAAAEGNVVHRVAGDVELDQAQNADLEALHARLAALRDEHTRAIEARRPEAEELRGQKP